MASVLLVSTPVTGHVTPLLSVAASLIAAGDRVRFLTGIRYRDAVLATGADFLPLPAEADYDDRDMDAAFPGRRGLSGPKGIRYDMIEIFLRPASAQFAAVQDAVRAETTDAILAEPLFAAAALFTGIPRQQRPLLIALGIVPLGLRHPDVAPFGLGIPPRPGRLGRLRNRLLTVATEKGVFAPVQRVAQQIAEREIGRRLDDAFLNWPAGAERVIQFTVPEFEYPRPGVSERVHFVGPVSRSRASTIPVSDWWHDLQDDRPVVHVTQGTVATSEWTLIEPTLRALAEEDVLVVVSTGGRRITTLPDDLPANVRAAEFLPYDKLLPLTDVLVTNGGYGGVHYALEHGVPIVVAGRTEDKTEVSARVAWSGVGVDLRTDSPKPDAVRTAVRSVLSDPRYQRRASELAAAIQRSAGADAVHGIIADALAERDAVHT